MLLVEGAGRPIEALDRPPLRRSSSTSGSVAAPDASVAAHTVLAGSQTSVIGPTPSGTGEGFGPGGNAAEVQVPDEPWVGTELADCRDGIGFSAVGRQVLTDEVAAQPAGQSVHPAFVGVGGIAVADDHCGQAGPDALLGQYSCLADHPVT